MQMDQTRGNPNPKMGNAKMIGDDLAICGWRIEKLGGSI
jgi:hypothetical protein